MQISDPAFEAPTNPQHFPTIPATLRKSLRELRPAGAAGAGTNAAIALHTWIRRWGEGPGVRVDSRRLRYTNACRHYNFPSVQLRHTTAEGTRMGAVLFCDQTALVGKFLDTGAAGSPEASDMVFLPEVFKLRRRGGRTRRIIHVRNPDASTTVAQVSFKAHARETHLAVWQGGAIGARDADDQFPAVAALFADLAALAPLFEGQPWIASPAQGPLPRGALTPPQTAALSLPPTATGGHAAWPACLPFSLLQSEPPEPLCAYLRDFGAWFARHFSAGFEPLAIRAEVRPPAGVDLDVVHPATDDPAWPIQVFLEAIPTDAQTRRRFRSSGCARIPVSIAPPQVMADPARFALPVDPRRAQGFLVAPSGPATSGRVHAISLLNERIRAVQSAHEALLLDRRFGHPRDLSRG